MEEQNVVPLEQARHRQASLSFLEQCGGYAVEAKSGEKAPLDWDPANNHEAKHKRTLDRLRGNGSNLGVHLFGPLVDVDDDSDSVHFRAALDAFLPYTPHTWGRGNNTKAHRAYRVRVGRGEDFSRQDWPILKRVEFHAGVEIRGGALADAHFTILPGSIHPDGDLYKWDRLEDISKPPTVVPLPALIAAVRKAAAIGLLAPFWVEGQRNQLCMALSGFLYRLHELSRDFANADTPDSATDMFLMDKEQSLNFLFRLMQVAGDDESDEYMRKKTFLKTWVKASNGKPVVGAKRLGEIVGDPKLVTSLYALLSDNAAIAVLDGFLNRFAIWSGPGLYVDTEAAAVGKPLSSVLMNQAAFNVSFAHMRYMAEDGKSRPLTQRLASMASATRIDGLTMVPGADSMVEQATGSYINLWAGFKVPPSIASVSDEDVKPFLDYVNEIIANGDPGHLRWVLGWCADIFQNPAKKPGTALVVVGKPGAGKTFLHEHILRPIIGPAHSVANNDIYNLTRDFNSMYANMLLIACDEATKRQQKGAFEKMKTLITDKEMRVEPKGKDAFTLPNYARFILTSNHEFDAVHLPDGADDRRYMVLKAQPKRVTDLAYWERMVAWLENPTTLPKIHRWLRDYDVDRVLVRRPVETAARQAIQQRSVELFDRWLMQCIARGHPLSPEAYLEYWDALATRDIVAAKKVGIDQSVWPEFINYAALVSDYDIFRRRHEPNAFAVDQAYIGMELDARGLKVKDTTVYRPKVVNAYSNRTRGQWTGRPRLYAFPSYEDILEYLTKTFGYKAPNLQDDEGENHEVTHDETFSDDKF